MTTKGPFLLRPGVAGAVVALRTTHLTVRPLVPSGVVAAAGGRAAARTQSWGGHAGTVGYGVAGRRRRWPPLVTTSGGRFTRIQGTPDLLPTDVTGGQVYDRSTGELTFRPGPVFTDIVLVDELNRAAPKTQSALLEVMQERRVTVEDHTHTIPRPFFVVATMNPEGHVGTYELPEAQLDRFMMAVPMGYPDPAAERDLVEQRRHAVDVALHAVITHDELLAMTDVARAVFLSPSLVDYLVDLVEATRGHPDLERGASPRASLALAAAVRARAVASARDHGVVDDVKALAVPVLSHRLVLSPAAVLAGRTTRQVMADLLSTVPTPTSRRATTLRR